MEITTMQLYWIIKLDSILNAALLFILISGICVTIGLIGVIWCKIDEIFKDYIYIWRKILKYSLLIFIVSLCFKIFLPTTKEIAAIIVLPKIINNEKLQEIPNKVMDLGFEWLEELKPTKQENK